MNLSIIVSDAKRMRRGIARAIACCLMLLILPSCGIPPLRQAQPGPGLPEDVNGSPDSENSAKLGIEEFYSDRMLTCLIEKALVDNRELRILNEEVAIAGNEVLSRSGAYLPFVSVAAGTALNRYSRFTEEGAGILDDAYLPGQHFTNPSGNFGGGIALTWQLDIYRQLRNARDAAGQRYAAASERRNYFVTTLVADIAENYYRLMGLDKRLENLNQIIDFQTKSLEIAKLRVEATRDTRLSVLRFQAELNRNYSEKLIINQSIIQGENRINFLVNRYPQRVERDSSAFYDMTIHPLSVGVPSQLLQNRPDIRQAERELEAAGLDVKVARVNFFPQLVINGAVGLQSLVLNHLFEPQAVLGDIAGGLVGPLVNKRAIRAQYLTANARQLQSIYNYQRVILDAFTQVVNRVTTVENYTKSVELKKQQMATLVDAVGVANDLYNNARAGVDFLDVLTAQQALRDARVALIDTKTEQLAAVVNTYQALGGGVVTISTPPDFRGQYPYVHTVRAGENFWTISLLYYRSSRYSKALWAANKKAVPDFDRLTVGSKILIPRVEQLDKTLVEELPAPAPVAPEALPVAEPTKLPPLPPPPAGRPGPFGQKETEDPAVNSAGGTNPPAASPMPASTAPQRSPSRPLSFPDSPDRVGQAGGSG